MAEKELTQDAMVMLGDYRRAIVAMAVPILVSLLIAQANTFIDTFWCAMLGSASLAAVGIVSSFYNVLVGLGTGMGIGVSAVVAAHIAMRDKDAADRSATQSLTFMAIVGLLCTPILLVIGDPIVRAAAGGAGTEAVAYAFPYYLGAVLLVLQGVAVGVLRGEGAARRSMVVMSSTALLNIVLDPIFAFELGLGISGLSWATLAATALSFIPFIYWYGVRSDTTYIDIRREFVRPQRSVIREFSSVGVPKALELDIMWGINFLLCYLVLICGGYEATAVYNTGWKYVDIIQSPANAFAGALIPVCSAMFATRDYGRMREAYLHTLFRSVAVTGILAVILFLGADYAVMILSTSETSAALEGPMAEAIRIYILVAVMFSAISVSSSLLQAVRKAPVSMWSTLLRNILLVVAFALLCHTTPVTMWWGFVAVEVVGMVLMVGLAEYEFRRLPSD